MVNDDALEWSHFKATVYQLEMIFNSGVHCFRPACRQAGDSTGPVSANTLQKVEHCAGYAINRLIFQSFAGIGARCMAVVMANALPQPHRVV